MSSKTVIPYGVVTRFIDTKNPSDIELSKRICDYDCDVVQFADTNTSTIVVFDSIELHEHHFLRHYMTDKDFQKRKAILADNEHLMVGSRQWLAASDDDKRKRSVLECLELICTHLIHPKSPSFLPKYLPHHAFEPSAVDGDGGCIHIWTEESILQHCVNTKLQWINVCRNKSIPHAFCVQVLSFMRSGHFPEWDNDVGIIWTK
jgi:hypothetical protein